MPFAALRVIRDPASRALPALAKSAIKPNGDIDLAQGAARRRAQSDDAARAGLDRDRFQPRAALLRGCRGFLHGEEGLAAANV